VAHPTPVEAYALAAMAPTNDPGASRRSDRATPRAEAHGTAPRVRDLPAPRRSQGVIGPLFRSVFKWPYRVALAGLFRAGLRPWQLTALSLLANGVIGWLLVMGRFFLSGLLLTVAGLLDIFDGGLARLRGEASRAGAFLDSVVDRVSDLILFGCLFWALAGQGRRLAAGLALSSLIVSLLVSHIRAEGEAMGLSLTEGAFQRLERYVMLMIGLTAPGALLPILVILTALGGFTVLQRAASAWRQLDPERAAEATPQNGVTKTGGRVDRLPGGGI
jgi:CDP-diacylglycerol--glycerol-3-phosphate 3-phosphatidyltransferase